MLDGDRVRRRRLDQQQRPIRCCRDRGQVVRCAGLGGDGMQVLRCRHRASHNGQRARRRLECQRIGQVGVAQRPKRRRCCRTTRWSSKHHVRALRVQVELLSGQSQHRAGVCPQRHRRVVWRGVADGRVLGGRQHLGQRQFLPVERQLLSTACTKCHRSVVGVAGNPVISVRSATIVIRAPRSAIAVLRVCYRTALRVRDNAAVNVGHLLYKTVHIGNFS